MKYHIEYSGVKTEVVHGFPVKKINIETLVKDSLSMESLTISGVIQSFLNKKAKEGIKIIKLKVQEDALNS